MNDYLKHPDAKALMRGDDGAYGVAPAANAVRDVAHLYLPERAEVQHARCLLEVQPGDRVTQNSHMVGGREIVTYEIVRAWAYPHPSHEYTAKGCLGCGLKQQPFAAIVPGLQQPCANVRCKRCGELNGLASPNCKSHP